MKKKFLGCLLLGLIATTIGCGRSTQLTSDNQSLNGDAVAAIASNATANRSPTANGSGQTIPTKNIIYISAQSVPSGSIILASIPNRLPPVNKTGKLVSITLTRSDYDANNKLIGTLGMYSGSVKEFSKEITLNRYKFTRYSEHTLQSQILRTEITRKKIVASSYSYSGIYQSSDKKNTSKSPTFVTEKYKW